MTSQNTVLINGVPLYVDDRTLLSLVSAVPQKSKIVPFGEYARRWFDSFKKNQLRFNTQKCYRCNLDKHILPFFGEMSLADIDVSKVQDFYNSIDHLSRSTVHQNGIILHQIFEAAIEDRLIDYNPTESVRLTTSKKVSERRALTQQEIAHIISQMPRLQDGDMLLLALMIYTGERRGEVLGLRWEDIDYESNLIHVQRAVIFKHNRPEVGPTKSVAGIRDIPLLPELRTILSEHQKDSGYIVGNGETPMTETQYRRTFERIERQLDLHGATAHVFRHTFLTMAVDALDLKTLQSIAGHASHVTTMRYVHKRDEKILEARDLLKDMFA